MTNDLGGRVAPRMSRPTGFYTTEDVAGGEAVKVGTLALLQGGALVDATSTSVQSGGVPVIVDRGEHSIPDDAETALDNRADYGVDEAPFGVVARVVHGEAFLLNTKEDIDASNSGDPVYVIDNDTVSLADDDVGDGSGNTIPQAGRIARVEGTNSAFVLVEGTS